MDATEQVVRARPVQYPESDGQPIGETDLHRDLMTDLIFTLKWFLSSVESYVAGNLFIYYEEGNSKAVVAPDVFVVLGVPQRRRRVYQAWREGNRLPDVVIEVTSKSTGKDDQVRKATLYAQFGVQEYFLFDPFGEYMRPQLKGYRLDGSSYVPVREFPIKSDVLGLELRPEDNQLRLYNPATGERLPTSDEEVLARRVAEAGRKEAEIARKAAETRLIAEQQARRIEEQARRAAEQRTAALEAELARLRAERDE